MPKVSVIIPVYNVEKYLRQCLDSVVNQTLKDIEIICIDDGSTDNSPEILQEYVKKDERIKIITQQNKGSASARNSGIKKAKGEYIGFIDADDYISINYYEELYNAATKSNADISATNQIILVENEQQNLKKCGINNCDKKIISIKDKSKIIITTGVSCNKIYKNKFLKQNKINCLEIKNPAEDNYFTDLAVICANKIAINNNCSYYYVIHNNSQTQKLKAKMDFKVFDVYKLIENRILKMPIKKNDKFLWLKIINERKKRDFKVFYDTMSPNYKNEFKEKAKKNLLPELIVSLTSYPARINTVNQTIESLLNQTLKADKVILWLAGEQFPNKERDLPQQLLDLVSKGLTIEWCEDIKSYKKLIPTLKKYPEAIIVTADDDLLYDNKWLEQLYNAYLKNPNHIHCHRAHCLTFENKQILPYKRWQQNISKVKPTTNNFLTGVGGVLYPPNCFYKDILKKDLFMKLCPQADDIWFWTMCVLNNKKINVVTGGQKLKYVEGTQETALWLSNVNEDKNDIQLNNIINYYPNLLKKLDKDNGFYKNIFERIFSIRNEGVRKVITIFGIKFKFKSKKLIKRREEKKRNEKIDKILKSVQSQKKVIKKLQEQVSQIAVMLSQQNQKLEQQEKSIQNLQLGFSALKSDCISIAQVPNITELAMLKTKYLWDNIKIPTIKNNFETIEALIESNKSIIRFGDGEFRMMEGNSIVFQKYEPNIANKLKEIFANDDEELLIGIPFPYYEYSVVLRDESKNFILKWFSKWHSIIEKYYKFDKTYYSTHISQIFPVYENYDFEKHYSNLKQIWNNKKITIVTGDRAYNSIEYNIFDNAKSINYIYGPTENAFDEYENLKNKLINVEKDNTLIFALGPAGKVLAYEMYHLGYRVLDLGHVIKDYDFYKKSAGYTLKEWKECRGKFFGKD